MTSLAGRSRLVALCSLVLSQAGHQGLRPLPGQSKVACECRSGKPEEGLSTALAHPSKADVTVVSVGPGVSVTLSRLFPEVFSGFLVGSGSGSLGFHRLANRRFHAT